MRKEHKTPTQLAEELKKADKAKNDLSKKVSEQLAEFRYSGSNLKLSVFVNSNTLDLMASLEVDSLGDRASCDISKEQAHRVVQFLIAVFGKELREPLSGEVPWKPAEHPKMEDAPDPLIPRSRLRRNFRKDEIS